MFQHINFCSKDIWKKNRNDSSISCNKKSNTKPLLWEPKVKASGEKPNLLLLGQSKTEFSSKHIKPCSLCESLRFCGENQNRSMLCSFSFKENLQFWLWTFPFFEGSFFGFEHGSSNFQTIKFQPTFFSNSRISNPIQKSSEISFTHALSAMLKIV
jgi:hypothetical protein